MARVKILRRGLPRVQGYCTRMNEWADNSYGAKAQPKNLKMVSSFNHIALKGGIIILSRSGQR